MLKSSGNRLVYFLFGISVGLLIGGGFFIFKIDEYISRMELFKPASQDTVLVTDQTSKNERVNKTKQPKKGNDPKDKQGNVITDSLSLTAGKLTLNDTTLADTVQSLNGGYDDVIEVKKDELVMSVPVPVINHQSTLKNPKDSILQNVSGIRDDGKGSVSTFQVEFWESPVNYRGYKMTKNKIVLFGIVPPGDVKIYKVEDSYYLRHQQTYYKVEFSGDFRGLEKVNDAGVIAKMN